MRLNSKQRNAVKVNDQSPGVNLTKVWHGGKSLYPSLRELSEEFFLSVGMCKITNLITDQIISDNKKMLISNFKKPLLLPFDSGINNVCSLNSVIGTPQPMSELRKLI